MNVKIIRLQTGEDIIGEVIKSGDVVSIKKPFTIIPMQAQTMKTSTIGFNSLDALYR